MFTGILLIVQLFFSIVTGMYFFTMLKSQHSVRSTINTDSKKELEKLKKLKDIKLTQPLSEKARPTSFNEILGQDDGIKALRAALCGPNPQHVIIYGGPGIGKTAAARLVLEEAKQYYLSPFSAESKFVEMDATTLQFDERSIADPLIGSVHDPIYQGAGAYGPAGVPQPKAGAVTKAHGGILFLDEIGELCHIQTNRLLKVLEDRKVFFESAYYSRSDTNTPPHIHEIFQNGLPADFRLVAATTRMPENIPPAIRSRCVEIFFKSLSEEDIIKIVRNAAQKGGFVLDEQVDKMISQYASNGRDAVNIVQTAGSVSVLDGRNNITLHDVEWVIQSGRYIQHNTKKLTEGKQVGVINGLAVHCPNEGSVIEIEALAAACKNGSGKLIVTGIVEQEEMDNGSHKLKRPGTARISVENVATILKKVYNISLYNIHINFPGGMPIDGPSAGIAIFTVMLSAIKNVPLDSLMAMTGEVSIRGKVKAVGGVAEKIEAARRAGIKKVLIPKDNWQKIFSQSGIDVVAVDNIYEVIKHAFIHTPSQGFDIIQDFRINLLTEAITTQENSGKAPKKPA